MKKFWKLVIVYIIWFVILFIVLNFIVYKFFYYQIEFGLPSDYNREKFSFIRHNTDYNYIKEDHLPRSPVELGNDNGNIVIFGCSYGYGYLLEHEQTFHYKLSQALNRSVYNLSCPGEAPQFAIMKIKSHDFDDILKKSDYAIFVTIGEHLYRVHSNSNGWWISNTWPRYDIKKEKDNKYLVFHKYRLAVISDSYFWRYIRKVWFSKIISRIDIEPIKNYLFDNVKLHFETILKDLQEYNPNIKMIIIVYPDDDCWNLYLDSPRWKELEDEGIIVVKVKDIIEDYGNSIYQIPNDGHPSEFAWQNITNYLVNQTTIFKN